MQLIRVKQSVWIPANRIMSIDTSSKDGFSGDYQIVNTKGNDNQTKIMTLYQINLHLNDNETQFLIFDDEKKRDAIYIAILKQLASDEPLVDYIGLAKKYDMQLQNQ